MPGRALILLIILHPLLNSESLAETEMAVEYRRDDIDYNNTERYFVRDMIGIRSENIDTGACHVYMHEKKEHRMTCHLKAADPKGRFYVLAGSFNADFGAGLVMGKKQPALFDQFSYRQAVPDGGTGFFSPCRNGNPLYCFRGGVLGAIARFDDLALTADAFYSVRERFIYNDESSRRKTNASLNSINSRISGKDSFSEPARMITLGGVVSAATRHVTLQFFYYHSELKNSRNKRIIWGYDPDPMDAGGLKSLDGFGFFSAYSDDYIKLFAECACTPASRIFGKRSIKNSRGGIFGLRYLHPALRLVLDCKKTSGDFNAPFSSEGGGTASAVFLSATVNPWKRLFFGGSALSRRTISSAGYAPESVFIKSVFLRYLFSKSEKLIFSYSARDGEKSEKKNRMSIFKLAASINAGNTFTFSISGSRKESTGKKSHSLSGGLNIFFTSGLKFTCRYSRFWINKDDQIYAPSRSAGTAAGGSINIKNTSSLVSISSTYSNKGLSAAASYTQQFEKKRTYRRSVEVSAKMTF
ncbi:MAG: hypothetical protein MUD12_07160 [Spirochaetes bacterium]|jgi:hypothetical protein|nr:hypothetical protein [Spirochaetota bacterium]